MVKVQPSHLYIQVRNELARRIIVGQYASGGLLPNEFLLAADLNVSVGTVRKGLAILESEDLVRRIQGRGTVVSDRHSAEFIGKLDRVRSADGSPLNWVIDELQRDVRAATPEELRILSRGEGGTDVIWVHRVRRTGNRPAKVEFATLPLHVFQPIDGIGSEEMLIQNLCLLKSVHVASAEERLTLVDANADIADTLAIPESTPVLRLERFVMGVDGQTLEWRVAYCNLSGMSYYAPLPLGARAPKALA